jgi:hypothetical protein
VNAQLSVIEPEALEYLPAKTLLRLIERSQSASKNCKAFQQTVKQVPELFRTFEEMDLDVGFCLDNTWISLSFSGDGPRLAAVWRVLRRHGFNTSARPVKGDTTFHAFWKREGQAEIFMSFSSSMCRRVQVGTRMVEQPVYETQCGEMPADLEIEAPKNAIVEADDDIPF